MVHADTHVPIALRTSQHSLKVSSKTPASDYTLSLGIDEGNIRLWTMLQTEVTPAISIGITPIINQTLLIIGLVLVIAVTGGMVLRFRRHH